MGEKLDHNPIIAALDDMHVSEALNLAHILKGHVWGFKGNDLLDEDPYCVVKLKNVGGVFADTKFHDTPKTVANRVKKYASFDPGPDFLSIHASGGIEMMQAAVEAANKAESPIKILAITILTSHDFDDCLRIYGSSPKDKVVQLTMMAAKAGVYGVVCSAQELETLAGYKELKELKRIVPGIGPDWYQKTASGQKRMMTPVEAIERGADFLVMGRAITSAENPVQAAIDTLREIGLA